MSTSEVVTYLLQSVFDPKKYANQSLQPVDLGNAEHYHTRYAVEKLAGNKWRVIKCTVTNVSTTRLEEV